MKALGKLQSSGVVGRPACLSTNDLLQIPWRSSCQNVNQRSLNIQFRSEDSVFIERSPH